MREEILEKLGLSGKELTREEEATLNLWLEDLSKRTLTLDDVRNHISAMRDMVERDLTKAKLGSKQDLFLKARLRNYMLLEAFLSTPEKAKEALERTLAGVAGRKS